MPIRSRHLTLPAIALMLALPGAQAAEGTITTVAGTVPGLDGDNGPATGAKLNGPEGTAIAADGALLIADTQNDRIRRVGAERRHHHDHRQRPGLLRRRRPGRRRRAERTLRRRGARRRQHPDRRHRQRPHPADRAERDHHDGRRVRPGPRGRRRPGGPRPPQPAARRHPPRRRRLSDRRLGQRPHPLRSQPAGVITTVAGTTPGFAGDGGPATSARLDDPRSVSVVDGGGLLIADLGNRRIRRVGSRRPHRHRRRRRHRADRRPRGARARRPGSVERPTSSR